MATIKSYTSVEQSRKLAEFLPIESADMHFINDKHAGCIPYLEIINDSNPWLKGTNISPCWSLASLLGVASIYYSRLEITLRADKKYNVFAVKNDFVFRSFDDHPDGFDNLVDSCYEMIIRLNELKML